MQIKIDVGVGMPLKARPEGPERLNLRDGSGHLDGALRYDPVAGSRFARGDFCNDLHGRLE